MADSDLYQAHRFEDWNESIGPVLWWRVPVQEAPYVGTPLDIGRSVHIDMQVGIERLESVRIGDVGGWPFDDDDEDMVWTRLPGAIRMPM